MNLKKEIIRAENLSKFYYLKNPEFFSREKLIVKAVDKVDFILREGEILGVIGESGCGKSTLGRILVRLEDPTNGELMIKGESSSDLMNRDIKKFREKVQIIFQNPFDTFSPKYKIKKIMKRALEIHNIGDDDNERYEICRKTLDKSGLRPAEDFLERYPHELSGGQLQRVSILRSMLLCPDFLVADEPVSMLDVSVRAEILNMLLDLVKTHKTAMVFISHDISITRYISNKIAVMYLGRIVEMGNSEDIISNPMHPYTQALISNNTFIDFDHNAKEPIKIKGEPATPVNPGPGCYFVDRCHKATEICRREYPEYSSFKNEHIASCHNISLEE